MFDRMASVLRFHGDALALRAQRQQVLAANIANADTPGYEARDFDFARALRDATAVDPARAGARALRAGAPGGAGPQVSTGEVAQGAAFAQPLAYRVPQQVSIDRNTVDLDRERASFADNALHYEATLRFINGHVRTLLSAIRGD